MKVIFNEKDYPPLPPPDGPRPFGFAFLEDMMLYAQNNSGGGTSSGTWQCYVVNNEDLADNPDQDSN